MGQFFPTRRVGGTPPVPSAYAEAVLLSKDFGAAPENLNTNLDGLEDWDEIQIEWYGMTCTDAIRWRWRSGGSTITTSGYYWRLGGPGNSSGDYMTADSAGYISVAASSGARGRIGCFGYGHSSRSCADLKRDKGNGAGFIEAVIANVAEAHDGINLYVDGASNITAGVLRVIGFKYPAVTWTELVSKNFGATPENLGVNVDGLGSYDRVRLVWSGLVCSNSIKWRWRSGGSTISTANYYERVVVGATDGAFLGDAGFLASVSITDGRGFLDVDSHLRTVGRTIARLHFAMNGSQYQHEAVIAATAEAHDGIRPYVDGAANITAGTMKLFGISYG